jgi:hypothetical protein
VVKIAPNQVRIVPIEGRPIGLTALQAVGTALSSSAGIGFSRCQGLFFPHIDCGPAMTPAAFAISGEGWELNYEEVSET